MKRAVSILALIVAGLGCCSAASPEPYYCWLAFGPSGKVRVLVRLEGDAVVLQRRLGEQADGKEERFDTLKDCKDVAVKDPDGKTTYVIRSVFDLELVHGTRQGCGGGGGYQRSS